MAQFGEWIKTENEQPQKTGKYIAVVRGRTAWDTYHYSAAKNHWTDNCLGFERDIVAWMPGPKPYKEA